MSKSHTGNFKSSLKCRLINPAKNEIGDRINKIIGEKVNVNQWRNTDAVITQYVVCGIIMWYNISSKYKNT